ncbi:MAG: hypothetical protein H6626_01370 [Pseudobdellovibrionaceae bacterium]|nr:hypothetical protein [Bdellovibrionales bacterium]USN47769.1 MAG: hypothetical protein H6626_01370 [Pseudobdellovibrionaceae bacterium]
MTRRVWLAAWSIFLGALIVAPAIAQEPSATTSTRLAVDNLQSDLTARLNQISRRIDRILGVDELDDVGPESQVRVKVRSATDAAGEGSVNTSINGKLALPRTQKRLHLFISNLQDEMRNHGDSEGEVDTDGVSTKNSRNLEPQEFSAGFRQRLSEVEGFHVHADLGFRMRDSDPFVKLFFRQDLPWKTVSLTFHQDLHYYRRGGYGHQLRATLDWPINTNLEIRQENRLAFEDQPQSLDVSHGLSLFQFLRGSQVVTYFIGGEASGLRSWTAESYAAGVGYRTPAIWKWFTVEVTPKVSFDRSQQFLVNPGISLQLEALIGPTG